MPIDLWHFRLGNPSVERLLLLKQSYPFLTTDKEFVCDTCHHSKQKKLSFPGNDSHSSCVFALIHVDIWGHCNVTSLNGYKYFLTIVDDHSRFFWIFLMHSKAETQIHLKNFVVIVDKLFDTKVKMIRSDNDLEFIMRQFYDETGIVHQTSCVETPQQNGIIESINICLMLLDPCYFNLIFPLFLVLCSSSLCCSR